MTVNHRRFEDLLFDALLLCMTWTLLLALPLVLSFLFATALHLALRSYQKDRPPARAGGLLLLGGVAGYVSFPAWVAVIGAVGFAMNLELRATTPPGNGGPMPWMTTLFLAPIFEEVLYRERLLSSLRPVVGTAAAIGVTSALFALPHVEPWNVLGTLMVGLALGTAMWACRSLALCIGFHMGLNLAALFVALAIAAPGAAAVLSWEGTLGFDCPGCESTVCGFDPFCCYTTWDPVCDDGALLEGEFVRPDGDVEFWINGVRALATTTFRACA